MNKNPASHHYFHPEESCCVTVHIYNCNVGSQQHITQAEPSWGEVTNEKIPVYFITVVRCWMTNISTDFLFSPWSWIVPFSFVNLVPGVLEQVPQQEQNTMIYHADIGCMEYNEQYRNPSRSWPCKSWFTSLCRSVGGHSDWNIGQICTCTLAVSWPDKQTGARTGRVKQRGTETEPSPAGKHPATETKLCFMCFCAGKITSHVRF